MISLLLVLALSGPVLEDTTDPTVYSVDPVCAHIEALDIDYISDLTMSKCPVIVPFFDGYTDKLHALFTVECESGGATMANTIRWGSGTDGIWSFVEMYRWSERLRGIPLDAFDDAAASNMAAVLVYETSNGWYHWWSCHRGMNRYLPQYGISQVWFCPPASYWTDNYIPPGSNRVCGGRSH